VLLLNEIAIMLRIHYEFALGNAKIAFENGEMLSKAKFNFWGIIVVLEKTFSNFVLGKLHHQIAYLLSMRY
jgi:hypothetical protein